MQYYFKTGLTYTPLFGAWFFKDITCDEGKLPRITRKAILFLSGGSLKIIWLHPNLLYLCEPSEIMMHYCVIKSKLKPHSFTMLLII